MDLKDALKGLSEDKVEEKQEALTFESFKR